MNGSLFIPAVVGVGIVPAVGVAVDGVVVDGVVVDGVVVDGVVVDVVVVVQVDGAEVHCPKSNATGRITKLDVKKFGSH